MNDDLRIIRAWLPSICINKQCALTFSFSDDGVTVSHGGEAQRHFGYKSVNPKELRSWLLKVHGYEITTNA